MKICEYPLTVLRNSCKTYSRFMALTSVISVAAKEALVKALGVGFGAVKPCDVEVLRDDAGKPFINLYGEAGRLFDAAEGSRIHVSLTHSKKYASAYVVLEA